MRLERFTDPARFQQRILPTLFQDEVKNNLIIGILGDAARGRYDDVYMSLVEHDGAIFQALLRTLPHPLQMSYIADTPSPELVELIIDEWDDRFGTELTGLHCNLPASDMYSTAWQARHPEINAEKDFGMRLYQITEVTPPVDIPGKMRGTNMDDIDLLATWIMGFEQDTGVGMGTPDIERARRAALRAIETPDDVRRLVLWEVDGQPVAMAGCSGPTPKGIRINSVYTPPQHRKHGYASAVVADLTQQLFDEGREFCFLYTDLANPTSNSIYQKIGYRPVCDSSRWVFSR